ncbi:MAG: hypothetical protein SFU87_19490 [Chitinophagaceae bacterium]|nr:hypothetical protein [Chitinophagaceae bacterium]
MKKLMLLAVVVSYSHLAAAQNKTSPVVTGIPKFSISLGGFKGGNITADMLKRIVDSSLKARDEKGALYNVTGFRVNYFFKSTVKDEVTEQTKTVKDYRAYEFYSTDIMSELWRDSIKDNVKKDDEMLIDNIYVRLKNGKKMRAEGIRFKVL